jgi:hypothetical protein
MADREQLLSRLKSAAWAIAAELGPNAAREALERAKADIDDQQWSASRGR